jgi:poly-gamma-glutamate synthesis protein (capsule biosynthesis protein)
MVNTLTLLLAGDAMLGRGVNEVMLHDGPAYPFESLAPFTNTADLFFANLECAITARKSIYSGPRKHFYFCADPIAAESLVYAGVDLVSLANNHALDADYDGLLDTLKILDEKGIAHVGAGADLDAACRPAILSAHGISIGVLGYCNHQQDFAATAIKPGIHYVNFSDQHSISNMLQEISLLAGQTDHVVVSLHWQPNWVIQIDKLYRRLARNFTEAGARIVWGHSPHHFQGVEWINSNAVIYSSGGLVDDYATDPVFGNDRQLLFELTLSKQKLEQLRAHPVKLHYAHTQMAEGGARRWIVQQFTRMCHDVGSEIIEHYDWLEVVVGYKEKDTPYKP